MMNLQRLSTEPSPLLRSVILVTGVVGLLATSGPEGSQNGNAASRKDISAPSQLAGAPQPSSVLNDDLGQTDGAMAELAGAVAAALFALDKPDLVVETASINSPDVPPTQPAPVQVASADPSDLEIGDANRAVNSIEIIDECLVMDICVDRYLWTLYQRTPKEDTIKVPERRKVLVKRKGKMVTVTRTFTTLVDQDFGWKDPKAAERVRMPMMDYVIGGMDRSFKLKLFHMLHAAESAGLSPGITSAFRDDYRQSIASGLKAASNKSFHGGSSRGGYGHGLAADIVSVQGGTRNQRWASSDKLWKWVDAHGKEFGIGRPYLGRDPPHVAPLDGREYAAHNRGTKQASSVVKKIDVKKVKRVATRDYSRPAKRPRTAAVSKLKAS
ncbi:MAG: D-alanyl-D-alanine carboxypeptidase family protein [Afipia sp.]|nr:D-alanyl-D-alanine carboxypeptidase family protein [Afipia sp.]